MRQAVISTLPDGEFGTGLRSRLEVVREREREEQLAEVVEIRPQARREESPELALVSPELSLGELLLDTAGPREAPLGALLAEAGLLGDAEIDVALEHARANGTRLGEALVELGFVQPAEVVRLVAAQRGLPFVDVRGIPVDPAAARLLPVEVARGNRALPVGFARGVPVVAVADPTDHGAMHGTRSILHGARFVASPEDSILDQLGNVYATDS
jgi:Type II secretion system (T2SS), protein E, N-terminal domain